MAHGGRPELSRQQRRAQERAERKSMRRRASGAIAVGAILAAGSASAATFTVSNLNDSGSGSLRDAVTQANSAAGADTIVFQSGLTGTITLTTGVIPITDSVTINGPGAGVITVSGNNASTIIGINNTGSTTPIDVGINNLTFTSGNSSAAGAIFALGENLTLDHVTINNSTGGAGGALYFVTTDGAALTITNSNITGNTAYDGAGIIAGGGAGTVTISNTSITSNNAASLGGGIELYHQDGAVSITGCTISGNTAAVGGGVLSGYDHGALTISNSNITNNIASQYYGGGALFYRNYAATTLNNDTISGNSAGVRGGGIFAAIYTTFALDINNTLITGNTSGTLKSAPGYGGGIAIRSIGESGAPGTLNLNDSIVSGNVADPADAAVVNGTTASDTGMGGGIYSGYASMYIRRSTISGNTANVGGGIYQYGGYLTLENVTLTQNTASTTVSTNPMGAGLYSYYGTTTINESTITSNTTTYGGGGIDSYSGKITLTNSIVANNTGGATTPDVYGGSISPNYTLIKTPGSATLNPGTGNLFNVDPNLGPLAANSSTIIAGAPGTTQTVLTQMPECPSPVINAGDPAFTPPPSTDERGKPRVASGRIDMGAVEVQPATIAVLNTTQSVAENGGTVVVTVTRTGSADGPVDVSYATANGTATAGADYQAASGTLHWNDGDTANKTVTITILDDNVYEGNETFTLNLSAPTCSASLGAATDTITIIDNESQPTLSINSVSQAEGNSGTTPFTFTVTLSGPSALTTTVQYATANGTAIAPGDYATAAGTLTFNPGVTSQPITVNVVGDTTCEPNETFTVNLSTPTNATIANGTGTGTIQNDDPCATDLGITKIANSTVFFATHPATFNITVTNNGPVAANSVVVTDTLPAGTTFNSATPSQGTCSGTTTVTCSLGSLGVGANATIALTLTPSQAGTLQNTASVSAAPQPDPNPANDSSTATINVLPATDIPALSDKLLMALGALLAAIGAWFIGKKG